MGRINKSLKEKLMCGGVIAGLGLGFFGTLAGLNHYRNCNIRYTNPDSTIENIRQTEGLFGYITVERSRDKIILNRYDHFLDFRPDRMTLNKYVDYSGKRSNRFVLDYNAFDYTGTDGWSHTKSDGHIVDDNNDGKVDFFITEVQLSRVNSSRTGLFRDRHFKRYKDKFLKADIKFRKEKATYKKYFQHFISSEDEPEQ